MMTADASERLPLAMAWPPYMKNRPADYVARTCRAAKGGELRATCAFYCLGLCWSVEFGLSAPFCFFCWLSFLLLV